MKKSTLIALFTAAIVFFGTCQVGWGQTTIHSNTCASATTNWIYTNGGTSLAIQQGGYWLLDNTGDAIISEAFDVSNYTNLTLTFQVATYGSGTNHACLVEYSDDNGVTWNATTFTSATPTSSSYISAGVWNLGLINTDQLKFRWTSPSGGSKGVRIDNILFEGILPGPAISIDPITLVGFNYVYGSGPSVEQNFFLTGTDLTANLSVAAPVNYEIASTSGGTFGSSLSYTPSGGSVSATVYVRLMAGLAVGNYNSEVITASSTGANNSTVTCSGNVTPLDPTLTVAPSVLSDFSYIFGSGPSTEKLFTVEGINLTSDISIASSTNYEISLSSGTGYTTPLVIPQVGGTVGTTTVYVRLKAGLVAGSYNSEILTVSSVGATNQVVTCNGDVQEFLGSPDNLFFSEYIEGSSNNKALEIYNASGVSVDLSRYQVLTYTNGSTTPSYTLNLTGTLADGDVFVVANAGSNAAILAQSDITSTVTYYNGDDAIVLRCTNPVVDIDIIGVVGVDPGTAWAVAGTANATVEHTLIRKPAVADGNTDWAGSAGTSTTDSEWIVFAQDYSTDLGTHNYNPGGLYAETPTFTPPAGNYSTAQNVTIATTTPLATIYYTTDGTDPDNTSTEYTGAIPVGSTTTIKAIAYASGYSPSTIATAIYTFPIEVATIAALRANTSGLYRLTGEAVLTYKTTERNAKYIQDVTGAILIDDPNGLITTTYNLYDGISGILGTLAFYNSMLQFTPIGDPGVATSTDNVVVPEVVTLASLTTGHQAKLVKVRNTAIAGPGTFALNSSYTLNDGGPGVMRTQYDDLDYIGTAIPSVPQDLTGVVLQFGAVMQLVPRSLADFETSEPTNHATAFTAGTTTTTTIPLTWTDATTGTVLPEAYLIKGSSVSYAAIAAPVDGTPETDGGLVKNITQGTGLYTFTELTPGTQYFFKIYPYSGDGTGRNYKTGAGVPEATGTTLADSKTLNVKVFLEGPYAGSSLMNTTLNPTLIPLAQPYNVAPWNYAGTESVTSIPADVVDWVLVDLRDADLPLNATTSLTGWPKAFFLKSDGQVVSLDGSTLPDIGNPTVNNNLFVVVRHRNHIAVMSANGMTLAGNVYSYDFSTTITQAYNGSAGYKEIATGMFGLVAGDADGDGSVYPSDYNEWASKYNSTGYENSDFDMDSNVYPSDYNKWASNYNKGNPFSKGLNQMIYSSQVPVFNNK